MSDHQFTHRGVMVCKCSFAMPDQKFPLSKGVNHLNSRCKWSCCNEPWVTDRCSKEVSLRPTGTYPSAATSPNNVDSTRGLSMPVYIDPSTMEPNRAGGYGAPSMQGNPNVSRGINLNAPNMPNGSGYNPNIGIPRANSPTMNVPSIHGPNITGPAMTMPKANAPRMNMPTGPQINGPQFTGPQINGPQFTGSQINGPSVNGPRGIPGLTNSYGNTNLGILYPLLLDNHTLSLPSPFKTY